VMATSPARMMYSMSMSVSVEIFTSSPSMA
jgi:hypothetical protein